MDKPETPTVRKISKLRRNEWVKYNWYDYTVSGDKETTLVRGTERTPNDGVIAGKEFDLFLTWSKGC